MVTWSLFCSVSRGTGSWVIWCAGWEFSHPFRSKGPGEAAELRTSPGLLCAPGSTRTTSTAWVSATWHGHPRGFSRNCKYFDNPDCLRVSGCCGLERTAEQIKYRRRFCFPLCFQESLAQTELNEPELMEPRLKSSCCVLLLGNPLPAPRNSTVTPQFGYRGLSKVTACCQLAGEGCTTGSRSIALPGAPKSTAQELPRAEGQGAKSLLGQLGCNPFYSPCF